MTGMLWALAGVMTLAAPGAAAQLPAAPTDAEVKRQRERLDLMLAAQAAAKQAAEAAAKLAAFDTTSEGKEVNGPPDGAPATIAPAVAPASQPNTDQKGDAAGRRKFGELDLGVGLSFTLDRGDRDRIGDAFLDENRIVRVSDQNNVRARIMLEAHYFFSPCGSFLGHFNTCVATDLLKASKLDGDVSDADLVADVAAESLARLNHQRLRRSAVPKRALWGLGPFVAIEGGGDSIINAIGAGFMIGFRKSTQSTQSFNFGIGYVVDPNTRVLGDGVRENQPLPDGETQVRFKETAQGGLLVLASFSF